MAYWNNFGRGNITYMVVNKNVTAVNYNKKWFYVIHVLKGSHFWNFK